MVVPMMRILTSALFALLRAALMTQSELRDPPLAAGKLVALPVLGGIQHDYRLVA